MRKARIQAGIGLDSFDPFMKVLADTPKRTATSLVDARSFDELGTNDWYTKFIGYTICDDKGRANIPTWLEELWPETEVS